MSTQLTFASSHFESMASNASIRKLQFEEVLHLLDPLSSCVIMADFNHSSYNELQSFFEIPNAFPESPSTFRDVTLETPLQATAPGSSKQSVPALDPLRDMPTWGSLFPYYEGSKRREKRKPRRLDLILVRGPALRLSRYWTDGDKPIQVERNVKPHKPMAKSAKGKPNGQRVRLRYNRGKSGYCCTSFLTLCTFLTAHALE
jgi:hypothetical protein